MNSNNQLTKRILLLALATVGILMLPLIAMKFSAEVVWTLSDFVIMGVLIFGTGLTYLLATSKSANIAYRFATGMALASAFFLIWSNGAVGLIGSENNEINMLFFGVIAVGIIGAALSRFQPDKMALTLFTMAFAQLLISIIALIVGAHQYPGSSVYEVLAVNGFFITLFVVSGLLFRYAADKQPPSNAAQVE